MSESGDGKPYQITPALIALNGTSFALNAAGFFIVATLTNFGQIGFRCDPFGSSLLSFSMRYAGFAHLLLLVLDAFRPIFMICSGHDRNSKCYSLHRSCLIVFYYAALRFETNTACEFFIFTETVVGSFRDAYFILINAAPSKQKYRKLRILVIVLQFLQNLPLIFHLLSAWTMGCVVPAVLAETGFVAMSLAYNTGKLLEMRKPSKKGD